MQSGRLQQAPAGKDGVNGTEGRFAQPFIGSEHFQEKCEAVFRSEMRRNKEIEHVAQKCAAVLR